MTTPLRITRRLIDDGFVTEHEPHRFFTEASTLGLGVGVPPRVIPSEVGVGNGQDFEIVKVTGLRFDYRQRFGCLTLTVFND
jgi:hypothetical protein